MSTHDLYRKLGDSLAVLEAKAAQTRYLFVSLDHDQWCEGGLSEIEAEYPLTEGWFYEQYPSRGGRMCVTKRQCFGDPVTVGYIYKLGGSL